jgi:hypothetical protein
VVQIHSPRPFSPRKTWFSKEWARDVGRILLRFYFSAGAPFSLVNRMFSDCMLYCSDLVLPEFHFPAVFLESFSF